MILQSLYQLYDRLQDDPDYQIASPGHSLQKITFKVLLRPDGRLFEIQDARIPWNGQLRPQLVMVPGSAKPSGSGLNPCFLWDNTGYMLGFKPDDPNPERTTRTSDSFRSRHLDLEREIGSPAFSAVCRFLESWDPGQAGMHPVLAETTAGFGVFQIQGEASYVHQDPQVQAWWARHDTHAEAHPEGQCLITGETAPIASTHPKIKGVRDAQSSGAVIVGFNEDAYESYGKKQSHNAPVSEGAAFCYTTAVNALLDGPMAYKHRLSLGDTTVIFWTAKPTATEDIFARFASEGSTAFEDGGVQDEALREKLKAFLNALRKGREAYGELEDDPDTSFFLLGLAPNAARLSIRFFYRNTLSELLENLRRHYADIRIEPQPASGKRRADPEFPPAWTLLTQTARESKEIPPILAGPLLRAIISGARYPEGLFSAVIRRIHADRVVNYPRVCVIKGYLTRNRNQEVTMSLNIERKDPAYRLGRLFAALEKTQLDALGGRLNATIRDRFYSSASATPRTVFPRLLRTYQHHLAKLEGGFKVNREKLAQEIMAPLEDFPAHLTLGEQGLFALGYYHQTRDFYTKKNNDRQAPAGAEGDPQ